ncbi:30S ribosomal protein S27ae [Candidatus Woesearchaeota archaeon]|nr:30S ribosomal protein S27ae [Candidatus Woesearchaeota archaeon]
MAEEKEIKKEARKEPKEKSEGKKSRAKNKVPSKTWKYYEAAGSGVKRKNKFCPKCGSGFFMAIHKDRESCGNCGYTEFTKK